MLPPLKAHMFGRVKITYQGKSILFNRKYLTKTEKLLIHLLYAGSEGVARGRLFEELYGIRYEATDSSNNLRVLCYRLKKMLVRRGLPEYEYTGVKNGIYYFFAPMEVELDASFFLKRIHEAEETEDRKKKNELLKQAVEVYAGEFLENWSGEEWVLQESMKFKDLYTESLSRVLSYLQEIQDYEEAIRLCASASKLYPFDEWQAVTMDCYIAQKRYSEAFREYERTADLYFKELGIAPPETMERHLKLMEEGSRVGPGAMRDLKEKLREEERDEGPFYCTLLSFRDEYRFIRRIMERSGQSVFLMLCTITDGKGNIQNKEEHLEKMAGKLHEAIRKSLRYCDSFARFSPAQYVILLVGINLENCTLISDRLIKCFSKEHVSWRNCLDCRVSSIAGENSGEGYHG